MTNHFVFDIEVFKHGWLVVFKDIEIDEVTHFVKIAANIDTNIREWMDQHDGLLLCGFNNKHYDDYILKAIYYGFCLADIKDLNDFIIGGGQGWEWSKWNYHRMPFETYDIRDDLPITLSLKEIEGNMGLDIVESPVPFDLDRPLTEDEWIETLKYCKWDVDATDRLRQKRQAYLESKIYVGALAGLTPGQSMGMTNAKLTAAYLTSKGSKPKAWGDATDYKRPKNLKVANKEVRAFFKDVDPTYERRATVVIAGVEHTLAYGGLHGAIPNYIGVSGDGHKLVNVDVTSYYPSLMIQNGYVSRAVTDPDDFVQVYHERVEAKKNGDKAKNEALKLVLNTTYGAMNNQYNALYDPLMANSVCISGQLYLIDLIEKLDSISSVGLIQSNTDGILIEYEELDDDNVKAVVNEWEERTGFVMEYEDVDRIFQKDVNNYVMQYAGGKVKVKGAYVSNYTGGTYQNASIPIVAKAIVEYLLNGIPVEDTIDRAENILDFQMIAKTGRSYDKTIWRNGDRDDIHEIQRVNRVYASLDSDHGTIYKIKKDGRKDKIANLPDSCHIDNENHLVDAVQHCPIKNLIDVDFYIDMAKKRIQDFIGDQGLPERKEEESKMKPGIADLLHERFFYHPESDSYWKLHVGEPYIQGNMDHELSFQVTKQEYDLGLKTGKAPHELQKEESIMTTKAAVKTTPEVTPATPKSFAEKMFDLRKEMASYVWEKDGINVAQKYSYITEAQYKKYFEKALEAIGLDYFSDINEVDFMQNLSQSNAGNWTHLTTVKATYTIFDPISGEGRSYTSFGQGADSGDKGIYKAMTGALKYFIATNFLIAENNDPENDEESKPKTNRPAAPEKREEIKKELMAKDEPATAEQKALIKKHRDQLKAAGQDDVVAFINATMKTKPTKVEAGVLIMDLEESIDELDDNNG